MTDNYRATHTPNMLAEFHVRNGLVVWASLPIGWVIGMVLGVALLRLRHMGWKVEKLANSDATTNPGGPTV